MKDYADRAKRELAAFHISFNPTRHDYLYRDSWPPKHLRRSEPSKEAARCYVPSHTHNLVNFTARQESRKRRNQGPKRYFPGPDAV